MRRSVNEANMGLRQSLKTVERGGVATLAQGMQQVGGLQSVEVTTLDPSDAEIIAGAGLSAGTKLPVKVETRTFRFFCRRLVHTQAAWDALSDAMKDQTIVVTQSDAPIGSEAKCFECDAEGNVTGRSTWVMGPNGWLQDSFTSTDGSTLVADKPVVAPNVARGGNKALVIGNSIGEGAFGLSVPSGSSWCGLPGGAANLNDIAHPSYRDRRKDHQIQLKCVRAGAVGTDEPEWPEVGQEIDDGAARWLVERCTQAMNQNAGYFNIAQELLGQPLEVEYSVGGPGRRSEFILGLARRALTKCSPDVIFMADMFANDISQLAGDMNAYELAWNRVEAFLDEQVAAGIRVVVEGVMPGGMFSTSALRAGAAYFQQRLETWCRSNHLAVWWDGPSEIVTSTVLGEYWNPDDVTTYQVASGTFTKITDGIHPQNVAHWRLGRSLSGALQKLELPTREFREFGGTQRWENPRNLGTAGSLSAGVTGQAPTGWSIGRDGVAVATSSLDWRDDGVRGYWWTLAASSTSGGKIWAYRAQSLVAMGFAVGDEIEFLAEIVGAEMSPTAFCPRIEIRFYNATEYPAFASLNFAGGQQFGQAMTADNLVQVVRPIPFALKVPPGTTDIAVIASIEGSGEWSGTLRIGRINIINRSAE